MDRTRYLDASSAVVRAATNDERVSCVVASPAAMASNTVVAACSLALVAIREGLAIVASLELFDAEQGEKVDL